MLAKCDPSVSITSVGLEIDELFECNTIFELLTTLLSIFLIFFQILPIGVNLFMVETNLHQDNFLELFIVRRALALAFLK